MELKVFYTWGHKGAANKFDPDFGKEIEWDIPLLDGYSFEFCENNAKEPGSHHFFGIKNPKIIAQIDNWQPDVIWVWGWAFQSHLRVMRHFKGRVPIWFRGDSTLLDETKVFSIKKIFRYLLLKWVYKHVDKAYYVGTHNKAYYKKFGLNEGQLIYAPHAIDNNRFKFLEKNNSDNSNISNINHVFNILYVGKLEPRKNPKFLVNLFKKLDDAFINLTIIGSGPLRKDLELEFGDDRRIHFLGFKNQKELPLFYSKADLFILPSISETWGLAINEALACGIPVAASVYCGGAIDMINEQNGFLFDPKEGPKPFIEKLKIFRDKGKVDFVADFEKKFSYKNIIEAVKQNLS